MDLLTFVNSIYDLVTFDTFLKFTILYFFIIWISILLWVMKDISNRTDNVYLQVFSVLIILFWTPLWIFIYLLVRPQDTLFEKYYAEIEENLDIFHKIIEDKLKEESDWDKVINDNEIIKKDLD